MKIDYNEVKESVESQGWQIVSTEYSNLKTDLELICPEGHQCFVSYQKWRTGKYKCPICKNNSLLKTTLTPPKKNGERILAFDQASGTSGWSVYDNKQLIDYGSFSTTANESTIKIAETKCWFASMIDKWHPDLVVLEDIQLQKHKKYNSNEIVNAVTTYKKLAHLQGVLSNYCYEINQIHKIVPVATWRNFSNVTGSTRTDRKRSAQLRVKALYDISVTQDEADAILIGRWGAHNSGIKQMHYF